MKNLPKNIDFKIIHGFQHTSTVDIVLFNTNTFEKTGCEHESEIFRVSITNLQGKTSFLVKSKEHEQTITIADTDVKNWTDISIGKPVNCS